MKKEITITDIIRFNEKFNIRSEIRFRDENGTVQKAEIRHPAEQLEGGAFVVWVVGRYDAVKFEDVILE